MEQLADAVLGAFAMFAVFGSPVAAIALVLRHKRQMKQLEIDQIEAQVRLAKAQGIGQLPEYIDPEDPEAVAAYRRARAETLRSSAKHAAAAQSRKL